MKSLRIRVLAGVVLAIGIPIVSIAQESEPLARFDYWDLHVFEDDDGKTCVVASQPIESRPDSLVRSEIVFMVTDWPADGIQNEIHVEMGYPLDSAVAVTVNGGSEFSMDVREEAGEGAWFPSTQEDDVLTQAMKRGTEMVVTAVSGRGNRTWDTYSLIGISAALARSAQECN